MRRLGSYLGHTPSAPFPGIYTLPQQRVLKGAGEWPDISLALSSGITWTAEAATETGQSPSTTFTSQPIGPEDAGRTVFVAVAGMTNDGNFTTGVSGVTVGGNSCTQLAVAFNDTGNDETWVALYSVSLATGTTANVVVSHDGGVTDGGSDIVAITGYFNGLSAGTTAAETDTGNGNDAYTDTLNVTATTNDLVVAVQAYRNVPLSWSGDFGTTEDAEHGATADSRLSVISRSVVSGGLISIGVSGASGGDGWGAVLVKLA